MSQQSQRKSFRLPAIVDFKSDQVAGQQGTALGITTNSLRAPTFLSVLIVATLVVGCSSEDSANTTSTPTQAANSILKSPSKPKYVRPKTADNGAPFPAQSGYIKNYPVQFTDGYATVTVDNSQNDSDVFVKLFSLDHQPEKPIRVFFIRARETFTAEQVRAGNYDVRYRDLDSGGLSRTESFNLQEIKTAEGIQFSRLRLTLYKVPGGNMQTREISENEF
jgi:hypothetical protein